MDFRVSKKETRRQPDGAVDVLVNNVFDLYPIFADDPRSKEINDIPQQDKKNFITDVEVLDNETAELLDRAMFAVVKQRGNDPTEPEDGNQWAEAIIGDVAAPELLQQVYSSVSKEGSGVRVTANTVKVGKKECLTFKVGLTNII